MAGRKEKKTIMVEFEFRKKIRVAVCPTGRIPNPDVAVPVFTNRGAAQLGGRVLRQLPLSEVLDRAASE